MDNLERLEKSIKALKAIRELSSNSITYPLNFIEVELMYIIDDLIAVKEINERS